MQIIKTNYESYYTSMSHTKTKWAENTKKLGSGEEGELGRELAKTSRKTVTVRQFLSVIR